MKCPKCGSYDVYVRRTVPEDEYTQRYRKCGNCGYAFTTHEVIVKKNQRIVNCAECDKTMFCGVRE